MNGVIFDVKRFAVHDGGGIRSTLFLKGCPLKCPWCQNPEGMSAAIRMWHKPAVCIHCGVCAAVCPVKAITLTDRVRVDSARCTGCGRCMEKCPSGALMPDGRVISAEDAAALLLRDEAFFQQRGGVTLSGGEALAQADFACEVLRLCKAAGAHTAIETCLYAPWETVARLLPVTEQFIIDIKYFDSARHKKALGVPNEIILQNHRRLLESKANVLVRTPLIPGYTATEENIRAIAKYLADADPDSYYELLNFNPLCKSKYAALEREYAVGGAALSRDELDVFYSILQTAGIRHIVKETY